MLLDERWPRLSALPRIALAELPTRVVRLEAVSQSVGADVWCKRDDETSPRYGGNKVRKLEFLLGAARAKGARILITSGASGSHHCLATTMFGTANGFEVHLVLAPQPRTPHVEQNLRCDLALGAHVHPVRTFAGVATKSAELAARFEVTRRHPYVIVPGGSSAVGALGYVEAGLELASQIERGLVPEPDAIYVALGTAGTVAGAAVGLAAAGVTAAIVGVRVTDKIVANRMILRAITKRVVARLRKLDTRFPDVTRDALARVRIDDAEFGPGYGHSTPASTHAVELAHEDGLHVETTYTAKALAAVVRDAGGPRAGKRLLFWHTLSGANLAPILRDAPPIPERLARLMK